MKFRGILLNNKRVIIPNIDLKKFYRICAFQNITPESIGIKEKSFARYIRLREKFFGGTIKAEAYSIFIDKLRETILLKLISKEDLEKLNNKPLNPITIKKIIKENRQEISNTSAKALLSLLIKVNLLDQVNIIKIVNLNKESERDKELIYYYLLRRRDFISVKKLKEKFWDYPRKHKINDYLLELWVEDKINIKGLDVPKEICVDYNFNNLAPENFKEYESIETFRIRETGELRARILVNDDYKLYPLDWRD